MKEIVLKLYEFDELSKDSQTEVYSGFGDTEVESRAMLLIDLLDKKVLTLSDLNLN